MSFVFADLIGQLEVPFERGTLVISTDILCSDNFEDNVKICATLNLVRLLRVLLDE